jgi:signal transduction histidine kinase
MRWFRDLSLGIKLSLLLLLVLGVLLLFTILLLSFNTRTLTEEVGSERIAEEVSILQSRLTEIERELTVDVNFIASGVNFYQAVGRRSAEDVSEIVAQANESLALDDVDVVDGDGNRLVDTRGDEDYTQEDALLQQALSGTPTTAVLIEENGSSTEVSIAAAAPVVSVTGNRLGAIQISRLVDSTFLQELTFERDGVYIGLIYNDLILVRNTAEAMFLRSGNALREGISFDPNAVQLAISGQTVIADDLTTSGSVPHAVAYVSASPNAGATPAVLMVMVELDEIYAFQNTTLLNTIIVFVALTAVMVGVIYFTLYRIAISPMNRLKTTAQQMTSGQYDQRIPVTGRDELGQLAHTFNEMAGAVQQREASLRAAREQAERSDQVKSAFLASMSHELRTPLNAVINFTTFVIDGDTGPINEEQSELLTEVVTSARHLLDLINDVLDMSKIEAGSLKLFVEDNISVNAIVDSVTSTARSLIGGKPIRIKTDTNPDLPLIAGDRQRILQILLNIMSNACKFTDEGEIVVTAKQRNDEVVVAVSDTGPGIAPEDRALVFEAFKQTKSGLQSGGGTGLGMPIAKSLAEAHGGRLWLESVPGKGSTFYVALPIKSDELVPTLQ